MITKFNLFESDHTDLDPWGEEDWDNNNELDIWIDKHYVKIDGAGFPPAHWIHKNTSSSAAWLNKKNWLTYDQLSDSFIKRKAIIGE